MSELAYKRLVGTKKKILDAALIEFSINGLAGARVDRIASESGVNKAMIYYHFNSKENLYEEVINRLFTSVAQHVDKFLSEMTDPVTIFTKIAEYYYSISREFENFIPMFLHDLADGGERIKIGIEKAFVLNDLPKKIIAFMEKCKAEGTIRDIDSRHAMLSFIGMNKFFLLVAPIFGHIWDIEDENKFRAERPRAVVDLFLHGILEKKNENPL
ncbi:MAG: TetR/AcrR family transcriptional regulator [Candidatus Zixiibacteriota bacterium]